LSFSFKKSENIRDKFTNSTKVIGVDQFYVGTKVDDQPVTSQELVLTGLRSKPEIREGGRGR
jgi:formyltetrahydrofolate hydrolase